LCKKVSLRIHGKYQFIVVIFESLIHLKIILILITDHTADQWVYQVVSVDTGTFHMKFNGVEFFSLNPQSITFDRIHLFLKSRCLDFVRLHEADLNEVQVWWCKLACLIWFWDNLMWFYRRIDTRSIEGKQTLW